MDMATAPVNNLITEFVPSIDGHIHTHVVFMQRIINQVARTGSTEWPEERRPHRLLL